jgi:toxin-antitoxin system PIN domain toxin
VIALDTNILVYAHRTDAPFHAAARAALERLATGMASWAIPWPCAHEFLAVVTHPRIYKSPTPLPIALAQLRALAELPQIDWLAEGDGYLDRFETLAVPAQTLGGAVHDARIAALCLHHGVRELWSADRDFSRFTAPRVRNPLSDQAVGAN